MNLKAVATLGPRGTFSDIATTTYLSQGHFSQDHFSQGSFPQNNKSWQEGDQSQIHYFNTIKQALNAIGEDIPLGVLPIENLSEGFVSLVLDHLVNASLYIVDEVMLPIQFSFVSRETQLSDVKTVYVQFVAKGQCAEFLETLQNNSPEGINIVTTESNIESLQLLTDADNSSAAVVPFHATSAADFPLHIENINDYKNNQTRFLAFSASPDLNQPVAGRAYKTSIVVLDDDDKPGYLEHILSSFTKYSINLTSIVSRPTRQMFGKYHFFIDFDGHQLDQNVADTLQEVKSHYNVKVLGSYLKANLK